MNLRLFKAFKFLVLIMSIMAPLCSFKAAAQVPKKPTQKKMSLNEARYHLGQAMYDIMFYLYSTPPSPNSEKINEKINEVCDLIKNNPQLLTESKSIRMQTEVKSATATATTTTTLTFTFKPLEFGVTYALVKIVDACIAALNTQESNDLKISQSDFFMINEDESVITTLMNEYIKAERILNHQKVLLLKNEIAQRLIHILKNMSYSCRKNILDSQYKSNKPTPDAPVLPAKLPIIIALYSCMKDRLAEFKSAFLSLYTNESGIRSIVTSSSGLVKINEKIIAFKMQPGDQVKPTSCQKNDVIDAGISALDIAITEHHRLLEEISISPEKTCLAFIRNKYTTGIDELQESGNLQQCSPDQLVEEAFSLYCSNENDLHAKKIVYRIIAYSLDNGPMSQTIIDSIFAINEPDLNLLMGSLLGGMALIHRAIRAGNVYFVKNALKISGQLKLRSLPAKTVKLYDKDVPNLYPDWSVIDFLTTTQDPEIRLQIAHLLKAHGAQLCGTTRDRLSSNNLFKIVHLFDKQQLSLTGTETTPAPPIFEPLKNQAFHGKHRTEPQSPLSTQLQRLQAIRTQLRSVPPKKDVHTQTEPPPKDPMILELQEQFSQLNDELAEKNALLEAHFKVLNQTQDQTTPPPTLCLTPRGTSKIDIVVGEDLMAHSPQKIDLSGSGIGDFLSGMASLDRATELMKFTPHQNIPTCIPCDDRVTCFRASTLRDALRTASYTFTFDSMLNPGDRRDPVAHAMTTELLIKTLEQGSVYGVLDVITGRKRILIVASLVQYTFSGGLKDYSGKNNTWITLAYEVPELSASPQKADVELGKIFHFCTQEKHPCFVKSTDGQLKYLLCPLKDAIGSVQDDVFKVSVKRCSLKPVFDFLDNIRKAINVDDTQEDNQGLIDNYFKQWKKR